MALNVKCSPNFSASEIALITDEVENSNVFDAKFGCKKFFEETLLTKSMLKCIQLFDVHKEN